MLNVKFKTYEREAVLNYANEIECIQSAKELKKQCEEALNEELFIDINPKMITCYDSSDMSIFTFEYM